MLKCVYPTQAAKLGTIAATYRAGETSRFGSCPTTCPLLPLHHRPDGANRLDTDYLNAERKAVPPNGVAWSYTHFAPDPRFRNEAPNETTINVSADTAEDAAKYLDDAYDVVYAAPHDDARWPRKIDGARFIRCPAETGKTPSCQSCGGGLPLCARKKRDYIIVFVAHGASKKAVATKTGGCYANNFPCRQQWVATQQEKGACTWNDTDDPNRLVAWAKTLPPRSLLRHRIAGDLGCISSRQTLQSSVIHQAPEDHDPLT